MRWEREEMARQLKALTWYDDRALARYWGWYGAKAMGRRRGARPPEWIERTNRKWSRLPRADIRYMIAWSVGWER